MLDWFLSGEQWLYQRPLLKLFKTIYRSWKRYNKERTDVFITISLVLENRLWWNENNGCSSWWSDSSKEVEEMEKPKPTVMRNLQHDGSLHMVFSINTALLAQYNYTESYIPYYSLSKRPGIRSIPHDGICFGFWSICIQVMIFIEDKLEMQTWNSFMLFICLIHKA